MTGQLIDSNHVIEGVGKLLRWDQFECAGRYHLILILNARHQEENPELRILHMEGTVEITQPAAIHELRRITSLTPYLLELETPLQDIGRIHVLLTPHSRTDARIFNIHHAIWTKE